MEPREESERKAAAMREKLRREAEERTARTKPRTYVMKAGDSLNKIAKEVLGEQAAGRRYLRRTKIRSRIQT
jgi:nucleoid-associated protein YgaU